MQKAAAITIIFLLVASILFTGCGLKTNHPDETETVSEQVSRVHGAKYENPDSYSFAQGATYNRLDSEVFDN